MPHDLRLALWIGVALALIYVLMRAYKHRGLGFPFREFLQAGHLLFVPLLVPGAVHMAEKATGSDALPIFNGAEDRASMAIGAFVLIAAVTLTVLDLLSGGLSDPEE